MKTLQLEQPWLPLIRAHGKNVQNQPHRWRAISLRQPWAWLILHGTKDVENRMQRFRWPERILLHACKTFDINDYNGAVAFARQADPHCPLPPPPEKLYLGGIVGVAWHNGEVLPNNEPPWRPWHMQGQYGFVLPERHPLPFIQCRGRQGIWPIGADLTRQIEALL